MSTGGYSRFTLILIPLTVFRKNLKGKNVNNPKIGPKREKIMGNKIIFIKPAVIPVSCKEPRLAYTLPPNRLIMNASIPRTIPKERNIEEKSLINEPNLICNRFFSSIIFWFNK